MNGNARTIMSLETEIKNIKNFLQNIKISTDNIIQQQCAQQNYQHELMSLKQQSWGIQAFRTNQPQNQTIQTNFPRTQYQTQVQQQQHPIPIEITSPTTLQTTTLASPT